MPKMRVADDLEVYYQVDDFTDPWSKPETVILLHGVAENSDAWFAWVPWLARYYRVVRPDVRGFGQSTPMPIDYKWSFDRIDEDLIAFADKLGIGTFHLVAAKVGGTMAMHFAANHSERLRTLTICGAPIRGDSVIAAGYSGEEIERHGVEHWARRTQVNRLGSRMPPEAHEWWTKMMGATATSTQAGMLRFLPSVDMSQDVAKIACPTLVITTGSATNVASNLTNIDIVRAWQSKIPNSELLVLPNDSFHVAATEADAAAQATLAFMRRH
jgi:3-oxoadipate enol-lactonase